MKWELPDVQAGFRKGRGTRDQIANLYGIIEKTREFQRNIYFCFIDYDKVFGCANHNKLWKCLKSWQYQTTLPTSWETCMQIKKQVRIGYRTDWFQTGKGVHQGYILSSCLFNICKVSTSFKMPGWMKHKLELRLPREISITSDMQMRPVLW